MDQFPSKIQRILDEGYEIRFGDYISQGFNLAMKNIGGYVGFIFVYFALAMASVLIPVLGTVALLVIAPALMIGPYHVARLIAGGKNTQFGDFFKGFDKFGPLFLTALLTWVIAFAAAIPGIVLLGFAIFSGFSNMDSFEDREEGLAQFFSGSDANLFIIGMLLYILPIVYLSISFIWAPMLVWFHNMQPWPALMASRKITGKNWWSTFAFVLVIGIIAALGMIALGVGLLFTIPAMLCAQYAAFADITRLDEETPESDLIDHFVRS